MITVENLTKKFGEITAVEGLTFQVKEGEVFGFLGPNGAGKTTTIRMLCCLISKTSGEAKIDNYDISKAADSLQIRKMIGLVPDNVGLYEDLTAFENLDFYGKLYEVPEGHRKENIERFLKMLDIWDRKDARAGSFSKGMKQKLALARALVHEPKLLFMDEPTANLDPESAKTVRDFILEIKKQGRTIFLNTHNLDEAQRVCDRIGIIKTRLLTIGSPEQLKESLTRPKTEIRLAQVNEALLNSLKKLIPNKIEALDNKLLIDVTDPDKENPLIINAITSSGGQVREVTQVVPTLEDVYLQIVKETK
ncbi:MULTISPECIES: ABC transporter ATP-binding protein [Dehalococcoides]|uniref:ABC transporter ATP-binding protein n=1 Tax=Dehalococcoides mccartyi TaxID=61435 RepID=A0AB38Z8G8_9CHLR|nr:ABC transporter ATP-binding protein [Dehalococcoides mccartyi]OBW61640.1 MAG: multidrug ABC transporter ATP-binding protein [Dehalococcoides mccartyi]WRO06856.1 ABC transporter ATP-binding protein [Dehalococcoides mccartyi]